MTRGTPRGSSPPSPPGSVRGERRPTFPSARLEPAMNSSFRTLSAGEASALVGVTARAIGRAGLSHAYGHCSARLDENTFVVSPAKPMGLVTAQDNPVTVPVRGALPCGVLGEVRLHQQIYRRRAGGRGIVRYSSPRVLSLSSLGPTPRGRPALGRYF